VFGLQDSSYLSSYSKRSLFTSSADPLSQLTVEGMNSPASLHTESGRIGFVGRHTGRCLMRRIIRWTSNALLCLMPGCCWVLSAQSQQPAQPASTPPSSAEAKGAAPPTPAQSVGLFVYPQKEQDAALQSKDEGECYDSAKQQSGIDPGNLAASVPPAQAPPAPKGGGAKGAAGGAAAGAAVGAISGDAGEGAAIGATAGAVHGRRQQKKAAKQGQQQAQQQQATQKQQNLDTFKRAMSACLDARGYSSK
jgi:hypothetical protein